MKNREKVFSAIAVALLFLLMAWGNATTMLLVSALGLVAGLFVFRGGRFSSKLIFSAFGAGATATIMIVMIFKSRGH